MEPDSFVAPTKILQCSICLNTYDSPKALPCQHTFCYTCLRQLAENRSSVKCPECREVHTIPPSGIEGFRANFTINNLLDFSLEGDTTDQSLGDPLPAQYHQNQLPKNVDYEGKARGQVVVVIGHDNLDSGMKLDRPWNCAYHVARQEIFVTDHGNNRVMVYNTQRGNGRVFYGNVNEPFDLAISDDGQDVYILHYDRSRSTCVILIVTITGQLVKTIDSFPLGKLERCYSLVYHRKHLAVMSNGYDECVVIYTDSGEYVRHFRVDDVDVVLSIAVDDDSKFYILYNNGSVHIHSWHGRFVERLEGLGGYPKGIYVDGDGFMCVSRSSDRRVDVYDPSRRHVTSLGRAGQAAGCLQCPRGLCLIPDGRLVVVDFDDRCLQIF